MSVRASQWAWEQGRDCELAQGQLLTLLKIADHADQDGVCWPGEAHLAEYTAQGDRTIRRHLSDLESEGLLHRERASQSEGRGRARDRIFLHLDQPANLAGEKSTDQPATDDRPTGQSRQDQPATDDTPYIEEPSGEPSRTEPPVVPQEGDGFPAELFELWKRVTGRNAATKFSSRRRRAIRMRLKDGHSEQELRRAVVGCSRSDWHMKRGRHADRDGDPHNDLTLILRSSENVERFAAMAGEAPPPGEPTPIVESRAATAAWEAAQERLRDALPESTYGIWVGPLTAAGEKDGKLVLLETGDQGAWIERHYMPVIFEAVRAVTSDYSGVEIVDPTTLELDDS